MYVRSPEGVVKPIFECPAGWSFYFSPLSIDELGPEGTVAYTHNDKSHLYFTNKDKVVSISRSPSVFQYREHANFDTDGTEHRFAAWYRLDGDSLYAVRF